MSDTWRVVFFEPLDVLINADARGLDDGGVGLPGLISPAAFAGALRNSILKRAGASLSKTDTAADAADAQRFVGFGSEPPPNGFRFFGPLHRAVSGGEILLPAPRLALAAAAEAEQAQLNASGFRTRDHLTADSTIVTGPAGFSVLSEPGGERLVPAEGWVTGTDLASFLIKGAMPTVFHDTAFFVAERRMGHQRAPSGLPADHTLHSRLALRPRQEAGLNGLTSAGYAGLIDGGSTQRLRLAEDTLTLRLAGDGHVASIDVCSENESTQRLRWIGSIAACFAEAPRKGSSMLLYLASPAVFDDGWRPPYGESHGVRLTSAAVGRPQIVGGWDVHRGAPKQLYRAVPAGSVYQYEVTDADLALSLVQDWLALKSVSAVYPALGFGWGIPGIWDARLSEPTTGPPGANA